MKTLGSWNPTYEFTTAFFYRTKKQTAQVVIDAASELIRLFAEHNANCLWDLSKPRAAISQGGFPLLA